MCWKICLFGTSTYIHWAQDVPDSFNTFTLTGYVLSVHLNYRAMLLKSFLFSQSIYCPHSFQHLFSMPVCLGWPENVFRDQFSLSSKVHFILLVHFQFKIFQPVLSPQIEPRPPKNHHNYDHNPNIHHHNHHICMIVIILDNCLHLPVHTLHLSLQPGDDYYEVCQSSRSLLFWIHYSICISLYGTNCTYMNVFYCLLICVSFCCWYPSVAVSQLMVTLWQNHHHHHHHHHHHRHHHHHH